MLVKPVDKGVETPHTSAWLSPEDMDYTWTRGSPMPNPVNVACGCACALAMSEPVYKSGNSEGGGLGSILPKKMKIRFVFFE
jgi:hypothetical protein